jgi:hypothetical protein
MEPSMPPEQDDMSPEQGGGIQSDHDVAAPLSMLSGGEWERFAPGQFAYHPSPEDLAMPDLIEHFAQIEVVGNLLVISPDEIYEGGIAHDVDNDGRVDTATHTGPAPDEAEPEPDGDEEPSALPQDPGSKLPAPGGPNSWMNKKSGESNVPIPKQQY